MEEMYNEMFREIMLWRIGVLATIVIFALFCYCISEERKQPAEEDCKIYKFVEKHFGKKALEIFKEFI